MIHFVDQTVSFILMLHSSLLEFNSYNLIEDDHNNCQCSFTSWTLDKWFNNDITFFVNYRQSWLSVSSSVGSIPQLPTYFVHYQALNWQWKSDQVHLPPVILHSSASNCTNWQNLLRTTVASPHQSTWNGDKRQK